MSQLVARYLLLALAVLLLNFALPRLLPGDPLDVEAPEGLNPASSTLTAEVRARLRAVYHLDRPLAGQLVAYLQDLARGDLGWSISRQAPVAKLIAERLPWTLGLLLGALLVAGLGGSLLGLLAAWGGGRVDRLVVAASTTLAAVPEFLVALVLLLVLAIGLGWFPLRGGRTPFAPTDPGLAGTLQTLADVVSHLALPALTLVLASTAAFVLLSRGAVRAVLPEPYLVTARAKGLPEREVALRHAARNAFLPVLTLFGLRVGHIFGGALVVERVFALPGLGLLAFEAIRARDYPVLQAVFLLGSLAVLLANLALEVAYRQLEPRRAP